MYRWVLFLHVVALFSFFLVHGAAAIVSFKMRRERDIERIRALLELSSYPLNALWGAMLLVLITGIVMGVMSKWWSMWWIWIALGISIILPITFWSMATRQFNRVREAVGLRWFDGRREREAIPPASQEKIEELISSYNPVLYVIIGIIGIGVITWLMMFKPF
jgi:hypothetical protein